MSAWEYSGRILCWIGLAVVCVIAAVWLGSLLRQAWRDGKAWAKARREARAAGHLMRQVRKGRIGL